MLPTVLSDFCLFLNVKVKRFVIHNFLQFSSVDNNKL